MSAIVSESTSIIVPSTPTAGITTIPSFDATISPKASSVEARLDLSLDDLIKERKKEIKKEKKHESVKKETTQKQQSQKKSDSTTKTAQSVKRNALVNKNRGLPALHAVTNASANSSDGGNASKSAKKKKKAAPQTVVGKKAAAANKQIAATQRQKKSKQNKKPVANANVEDAGRKATSPKVRSGNQMQQQKKKQKPQQQVQMTQQQQPKKKKAQQQQLQQHPTKSSKTHAKKSGGSVKTLTVVTKEQARKVVRSSNNTAASIRITIKQAPSGNKFSNKTKNNSKSKRTQPKKTEIMNVVLPGKVARNFSNSQAACAQKVVKRVQNRKQSSSKNGAFVVRKPFVSRKN